MYLNNINKGTEFTIVFNDELQYNGDYDEPIDHLSMHVYAPQIYRDIDDLPHTEPKFTFYASDAVYEFTGRLIGVATNQDAAKPGLVDFRIVTPIKELPRREDFRVDINAKVRIFEFRDDPRSFYCGEFLCDAMAVDVSKNGMRIWADYKLEAPMQSKFILEITLRKGWTNFVPLILKRSAVNATTRSYGFDYGFRFDFTHIPERKDKLILEILEARIRKEI